MRAALLFAFVALSAPPKQIWLSSPTALRPFQMCRRKPCKLKPTKVWPWRNRLKKSGTLASKTGRHICGKNSEVLPEGIVVDSGYTNLMRYPLNRLWLVPARPWQRAPPILSKAINLIPFVSAGFFLTDLPQTPGVKPKVYDYVNLEAFPAGQYTYTSVGYLQRTVRKFPPNS